MTSSAFCVSAKCNGPGVQRRDQVDEHDLPVEAAEMLLVEAADHLLAVDLEPLRHPRPVGARPDRAGRQRAELQQLAALQLARVGEPAGLDEREAQLLVAALEVGGVGRGQRRDRAPRSSGPSASKPRSRSSQAAATGARNGPWASSRALAEKPSKLSREQRQVEQPLARIVDDLERQVLDRRHLAQDEAPGPERDLELQRRQAVGGLGPARRARREVGVEAGEGEGRPAVGADETGAEVAALVRRLEERQVGRLQQVVDHGGDQHRLAAAAQAGDGEPEVVAPGPVLQDRELVPDRPERAAQVDP